MYGCVSTCSWSDARLQDTPCLACGRILPCISALPQLTQMILYGVSAMQRMIDCLFSPVPAFALALARGVGHAMYGCVSNCSWSDARLQDALYLDCGRILPCISALLQLTQVFLYGMSAMQRMIDCLFSPVPAFALALARGVGHAMYGVTAAGQMHACKIHST